MLSLFNVLFSPKDQKDPKQEKKPISIWFWLFFVLIIVFALGIFIFAIFPHVALYAGLITSDQYVTITIKFYEFGFKVIESGLQVIPSIIGH